ncbi:11328_t:CDS:2 [Acaulospora colombiana]|uniref:11328_t:CDS:1 n=1 Tax=Acaulospora colombiana TaxID=27376 RepID=A0ACA9LZQ5_9GLOM|nr:11328_t:CDS:2 [Acaulospora colombiana]
MSSDEAWRQIQALEKELKLLKTGGPDFTLDHFLVRCEDRLKTLQAIAGNDDLPETTALYIYDLFGTIGDLAAGLLNIENATQDLQISTEQAVRDTASQMKWTDSEDDFPERTPEEFAAQLRADWKGLCDWFLANIGNPIVNPSKPWPMPSNSYDLDECEHWVAEVRRRSTWEKIYLKHAHSSMERMQTLCSQILQRDGSLLSDTLDVSADVRQDFVAMRESIIQTCNDLAEERSKPSPWFEMAIQLLESLPPLEDLEDQEWDHDDEFDDFLDDSELDNNSVSSIEYSIKPATDHHLVHIVPNHNTITSETSNNPSTSRHSPSSFSSKGLFSPTTDTRIQHLEDVSLPSLPQVEALEQSYLFSNIIGSKRTFDQCPPTAKLPSAKSSLVMHTVPQSCPKRKRLDGPSPSGLSLLIGTSKFDGSPVQQSTNLQVASPASSAASSPSSTSSGSESGSPAQWPSPRSDEEDAPSVKSQGKDKPTEGPLCDQQQNRQQEPAAHVASQVTRKDGSDQIQISQNEPPSNVGLAGQKLQKPSQVQISITRKRKWEDVCPSQDTDLRSLSPEIPNPAPVQDVDSAVDSVIAQYDNTAPQGFKASKRVDRFTCHNCLSSTTISAIKTFQNLVEPRCIIVKDRGNAHWPNV